MEGTIRMKGLFKSAVAIGAGLTVGKYLGGVINAGFNGIGLGVAVFGDEQMQKICNKYNVKYKKPENDDSPKDKIIGFHC